MTASATRPTTLGATAPDLRPPARWRRDERGVADSIVIFPALMVLFLLGVQFALAMHARHILSASAQDAATAAAQSGAPPGTATRTATADVNQGAPHLVNSVVVNATTGPATVTVTITAKVESLLVFLAPTVRAHASAPLERFVPESQR
jgi:Flp pilus assembly protein TadG